MRLRFQPKLDFTVMAQNHGVDHLGSTFWPMGSHWVQKMGQHRKKITMPSNSIFRLPRGHRFRPKFDFTVMAPNHSGDSLGSIFGQWDPIGSKKWVTTLKNYHALKFDYAPRSSISTKSLSKKKKGLQWGLSYFISSTKIRLYGYGAKSRCRPPRVHFVASGVPLGPKNGSKP